MTKQANATLGERLNHQPQVLGFGTSGRRGEIVHLTQLEIYLNVLAELEYLKSLPPANGGIVAGDDFYFAYDLRPSSTRFVAGEPLRGEICQAVVTAVEDAGLKPVNLGRIPTPALMYFATGKGKGSIMVTGSHIPFNRNGYKLNTAAGELMKEQELPINQAVAALRQRVYSEPFERSRFDESGLFKSGHRDLPPESDAAYRAYIARYRDFFPSDLNGCRVLVYQHSAVGRDLVVELLRGFGAEVIPAGRSEDFVAIDTENINAAHLANIQAIVDDAVAQYGPLSAVVSTDGDSDRPLLLGVEDGKVVFFPGDVLGMITAEYLGADSVVVPISSNDAVDRALGSAVEPKTRIGSPYVISGMERSAAKGRKRICGWEPNGGFLAGSDIEKNGRVLKKLATRDSMLPILSAIFSAREKGITLAELFARLPKRFSRAALLPDFPRALSLQIVERFSPADPKIQGVDFTGTGTVLLDDAGKPIAGDVARMEGIRDRLQSLIPGDLALGTITRLNYTDGVRVTFSSGDVLHFRPSGNADEFRAYAVSDTAERAVMLAGRAVAEPDGILRCLARAIKS
jgi:phosphomannomutase